MNEWDDACAQAERVRSGGVSPAELVNAAIARIEADNPNLNAVIIERFDKARKEAAGVLPPGPFRGVPAVIKDLHCPSEGDLRYEGTRFLHHAHVVADHDAAVVRRFREAGFVIVGRTNTPEFGTTITTEPMSFGPTRNPWDPSRSTGGSSGGSAAAVASGMVAVGHASDGGGSIRIPASECGLVGLKPARARVSSGPDAGEGWMGASTNGALTRTVRDAAAVLDALAGAEPGDPYAAPSLPRPLAEEVGADPGALRIGLLDHPLTEASGDPNGAHAVTAAGRLLERLGHQVEVSHPAALEEAEFATQFLNIVAVNTAAEVDNWARVLGREVADDELEAMNAFFAGIGRLVTAPQYVATVNWLHGFSRRVAQWWEDGWDVLVSPVINGIPPEIGWLTDREQGGARVAQMMQYTAQFNVTGQPAISLPLSTSKEGLPVGVQFVAKAGREDVLVRLAAQIEAAEPWAERHPGVRD
ncbi:MAG: amidase family protein [Actinomycetota bacterium]|nr:amidase family protein [Actinomycetota bacterium]